MLTKYFEIAIIILLISNSTSAQAKIITYGSIGQTKGFFSAELHAGFNINGKIVTAGYVAAPNATQPAFFQIRTGLTITDRFHIYAGAVRVTFSSDDKKANYNTYSVGIQYHTLHYDRGTIYYTIHYSPGYISAGIGMSFNLINKN